VVGIDLLEVDRMAAALERTPTLRDRLFTAGEQTYCDRQAVPARNYAARFCAKEAVVKALRLTAWDAREIEVVHAADGVPEIVLHGSLAGRAALSLSITHTDRAAAAVAMVVPS
jgi:holo-[acyl-carrier protein] synthase